MRILILSILLIASPTFARCDDFHGSRSSKFKDAFYDFALTRSALSKAPQWEAKAEFPPLSPKKAIEIALAQAKALRPEVTQWELDRIALEPVDDTNWIYVVTYQDSSGPAGGNVWTLDIPIYLDGSTITPKITKFDP